MTKTSEILTNELNGYFLKNYPTEAALVIETNPIEDSLEIVSKLPANIVSSVLISLVPSVAKELLGLFDEDFALEILSDLDPKESAIILSGLKKEKQEIFLSKLKKDLSKEVKEHMSYPYDSAGKLMDTKIILFRENETVTDATRKLRKQKFSSLNSLFVVDESMRLAGTVDIAKVLYADENATIASLMRPASTNVRALDPRSDIVSLVEKYNVKEVPVVDVNDRLLGIIRAGDLLETLKEDLMANMQAMVGVSKDEKALSSALFSVKKRLPWLNINLLTAFLAASVVGLFEDTIAKFTALAILLPVVAGQSGNAGAQALAVTMRGLALREISTKEWFKLFLKEFQVGLINGLSIAIVTSIGVFFWSKSSGLSLVIFISMILAMVIAGIAGALIPVLLKKLDQDPATSSSILLTTVTDVCGFFAFLGIATMLSSMLE